MFYSRYLLAIMLCLSLGEHVFSQPADSIGSGALIYRTMPLALPKGDSSRAILSRHHSYIGNTLIAQLGYVDTNVVTLRELWDNLEIGFVALPGNNYKIVEFNVTIMPVKRDIIGPILNLGHKVTNSDAYRVFIGLRPGDHIFFDGIRVQRNGSNQTVPIKNGIALKIIH